MSNEKNTSVEWITDTPLYSEYAVCEETPDGLKVICTLNSNFPAKENSKILAASREMLEALEGLVGNSRKGWQELDVSRETIDRAINAIKKARGEG